MTAVFPSTAVTVQPLSSQGRRCGSAGEDDLTALGRRALVELDACYQSCEFALEHSLVVGNQALLGMIFGQYPKAIVDHRAVHLISYVRGIYSATARPELQKAIPQERVPRLQSRFWCRAIARRPIAPRVVHPRSRERGAHNARVHARIYQAEVVFERLRQPDYGVLRRFVRSHAWASDQSPNRRRVHDVTLVLCHEARDECLDSVDDTPQVDTEDPFPDTGRNLPRHSPRPDPCVVADDMGGSKASERLVSKPVHLLSLIHI